MKKLLMMLVLMPLMALANTETVNGVAWTFSISNGQAIIGAGSPDVSAISQRTSGEITIPAKLGDCPVTSIGDYAFYSCGRVKSVTIPSSVTSIGKYAFYQCGIQSITFPSGITSIGCYAFYGCDALRSVTIPSGVTSIEEALFANCYKLESVSIPSSVTNIGRSAFELCKALTAVVIPANVTRIEKYAFGQCEALESVSIPEGVVHIGDSVFYKCYALWSVTLPSTLSHLGDCVFEYSGLEAVTIPEGVPRIGEYAFEGCRKLTTVSLPESLISMGSGAFAYCDALGQGEDIVIRDGWVLKTNDKTLSNVVLPTGLRGIGANAFGGCSSLWAVTIPEGVISIGDSAFAYCPSLVSINIPSSVREIGYGVFEGCDQLGEGEGVVIRNGWVLKTDDACPTSVILHPGTRGIAGGAFYARADLKSVTIPDGVFSIGDFAFYDCASLTAIAIPEGVPRIGKQAFEGCVSLSSVELPSSVTEIGPRAFFNCKSLVSVAIPSSVTSIGNGAFSCCSGLASVTIPSSVMSIGDYALGDCDSLTTVYVDAGDGDRVRQLLRASRSEIDVDALEFVERVDGYSVFFDLGAHGVRSGGGDIEQRVAYGESAVAPSVSANAGYSFDGWDKAFDCITEDVVVSANWEKDIPHVVVDPVIDEDEPMDAGVANTYDGVIVDADGLPLGSINIKAGKQSKAGISKITATVQMAGEAKKVTVKGGVDVKEAAFTQKAGDGRVLDLMFTRDTVSGTFDGYQIEGVRNLLASKDKGGAKAEAETVLNKLLRNYAVAYEDDRGWIGLSVSVMKKGKVKISGALADGTKVSTSAQMIVGEDYSCIPVIYTKKKVSVSLSIYLSNDGSEQSAFGPYDAQVSAVGGLTETRAFMMGGGIYDIFEDYELQDWLLPDGVSVAQKGAKWVVADGAKAGQIKLVDGEVVDKKESDNPSGLKLTFTAKTGIFKGSFKAYALDGKGKLKNFSATVNGIVVDGIGYGTATIKKLGSFPITIE